MIGSVRGLLFMVLCWGWCRCTQALPPDCDGNGIPDVEEIRGGAPDCDANGIPDACDVRSFVRFGEPERLRFPFAPGLIAVSDLDRDQDLDFVALNDATKSFLWGFLTRFEPARDVLFASSGMQGIRPIYQGPMGIDATFKAGYPDPLVMEAGVVERVDRRWSELFPGGVTAARTST